MNERDIVERLRERDEFAQAAAHLRIDSDDLIYRDAAAEIMSLRQRVAELEAALRPFADAWTVYSARSDRARRLTHPAVSRRDAWAAAAAALAKGGG